MNPTMMTLADLVTVTNLPIGRILALALDVPDLFDISDRDLGIKLLEYSDTLTFDEAKYEDEEEDTY